MQPSTPSSSRYHTTSSPASINRGTSSYSRSRNNNHSRNKSNGGNNSMTRQRGLFADGVWHCDCHPRLPAEHFRVKKDGPNHGRWFYTCQGADDKRCKFFLWEDDARPREEAAVLSNKRTEPGREDDAMALQHGGDKTSADGNQQANPTWQKEQKQHQQTLFQSTPLKRKTSPTTAASDTESDDDDLSSWPPTANPFANSPETPAKKQKTDTSLATHGLVTPQTSGGRTRKLPWVQYDETPEGPTTPSKPGPAPSSHDSGSTTTMLPTPTPARYRDALRSPSPALAPVSSDTTLTSEVSALLSRPDVTLSPTVRQDVLSVLARWEMKMQGVVKGRELVRTALRGKDARVVELQARIAGLEAEREVLRQSLLGPREEEGPSQEL